MKFTNNETKSAILVYCPLIKEWCRKDCVFFITDQEICLIWELMRLTVNAKWSEGQ